MAKNKRLEMLQYAAEFKLPTTAIVKAQKLGVLPRALAPLEKIEHSDRIFLEAFGRCWRNSGFISGGLAELTPSKREKLQGPKESQLKGWKAEANKQYEFWYLAEIEGHDYGLTIRELTAELKKTLLLTQEQHGELDAIRRAAKVRMQREVVKDRKEGYR